MGTQHWFYRSENEWHALAEQLKQAPCPHCRAVGTLNRHGSLHGYDEDDSQRKTQRARRVFCSNRHRRPGCGRTFSIWLADKIRRLSLTTRALTRFLQHAVADGLNAALRVVADCRRSDRTWQRLWKRFHQGQCTLRTALSTRCPPPELSAPHRPAAQVLAHLHAAFPDADCPIAAFQQALRIFFV